MLGSDRKEIQIDAFVCKMRLMPIVADEQVVEECLAELGENDFPYSSRPDVSFPTTCICPTPETGGTATGIFGFMMQEAYRPKKPFCSRLQKTRQNRTGRHPERQVRDTNSGRSRLGT